MSNYIYTTDGELYHASRRTHKYIDRIPLGNGKYRYFYSQAELDAYKRRAAKENAGRKATSLVKTEKGVTMKITKKDAVEIAYQKKKSKSVTNKAKNWVEDWLIRKGIYNPNPRIEKH